MLSCPAVSVNEPSVQRPGSLGHPPKELLTQKDCAKLFGDQGPATLDATQYMFENLKDPTAGASTNSRTSVFINTKGPFLDFAGPMRAFGRSWTQQTIRPLILLHELGHQLSDITGFKPDANDSDLNRKQSQQVVDDCFKGRPLN